MSHYIDHLNSCISNVFIGLLVNMCDSSNKEEPSVHGLTPIDHLSTIVKEDDQKI